MEQFENLRRERTALGVMCFLLTTTILTFVDILCVGAYFGIIFWLLYLTFLKDCLEILIYAIFKFITRLNWLYRILKVREILYSNIVTGGPESNISNFQESVSVLASSFLVENSPEAVTLSSNDSETFDNVLYSSIPSGHSLPSSSEDENRSSAIFESPESCTEERDPHMLRSLSAHVSSSTDNFEIDETKFEDVDLSDEKSERDAVIISTDPNSEQSSSKWNIRKMKFFDSIRISKLSSPTIVKRKIENIASKATEVLPHRKDDNEQLINNKSNNSPEQIGCCSSLPYLFKAKYQVSSLSSYARF